jgi:hypothetical protein
MIKILCNIPKEKKLLIIENEITKINNSISKNNNFINEFKKTKELLNEKGLLDNELINIIDGKIKKYEDYNLKNEHLLYNYKYELDDI